LSIGATLIWSISTALKRRPFLFPAVRIQNIFPLLIWMAQSFKEKLLSISWGYQSQILYAGPPILSPLVVQHPAVWVFYSEPKSFSHHPNDSIFTKPRLDHYLNTVLISGVVLGPLC
jgi:hypothetical protein